MSETRAKRVMTDTEEQQEEFEPLWGIDEYSRFMGIKRETIFSQISRKVDMPVFIKIGSITKWRPEAVREWIRQKEEERRKKNFEK